MSIKSIYSIAPGALLQVHDEIIIQAEKARECVEYIISVALDRLICDGVEFERISRSYQPGFPGVLLHVDRQLTFCVIMECHEYNRDRLDVRSDKYEVTFVGRFLGSWERLNHCG